MTLVDGADVSVALVDMAHGSVPLEDLTNTE